MYTQSILSGLNVTLSISIFALLIAVVPGTLLFMGRNSKNVLIKTPCSMYINFFDGVPVFIQIIFFYYYLPMLWNWLRLPPYVTAIIILSTISISHLAIQMGLLSQELKVPRTLPHTLKLLSVTAVYELADLIKNSTLLSLIGVAELFRKLNTMANRTGRTDTIIIAVMIYLILNVLLKLLARFLKNTLFTQEEVSAVAQ